MVLHGCSNTMAIQIVIVRGRQCKETLGDQFSVVFCCYVDIVDVKNLNMLVSSN